jgi:hypothetical protein
VTGPTDPREPPGNGSLEEALLQGDDTAGATTEPTWVLLSIVLGLAALTGSPVVLSLTITVALFAWLVRTAADDDLGGSGTGGSGPDRPFGGWPPHP